MISGERDWIKADDVLGVIWADDVLGVIRADDALGAQTSICRPR